MKIQVKATNIELTEAISAYVSKRMEGLARFVDAGRPDTICHVEVAKTTGHHKNGDVFRAEVRLAAPLGDIYVTADRADLYVAIDAVRDEAFGKLSTDKDKRVSLVKRGGAKIKDMIRGITGRRK